MKPTYQERTAGQSSPTISTNSTQKSHMSLPSPIPSSRTGKDDTGSAMKSVPLNADSIAYIWSCVLPVRITDQDVGHNVSVSVSQEICDLAAHVRGVSGFDGGIRPGAWL